MNVQETLDKFTRFFDNFLNDAGQPKYPRLLRLVFSGREGLREIEKERRESARIYTHMHICICKGVYEYIKIAKQVQPCSMSTLKRLCTFQQARDSGESHLDIDCKDLMQHDRALYLQLVRYPQEVITIFDMGLADRYDQLFHEVPDVPLQVRTFNLAMQTTMRELNPEGMHAFIWLTAPFAIHEEKEEPIDHEEE